MSLTKYFKDKDGNYIIRRISGEETGEGYFVYSGTYSSNYIFKKENLEEEVEKTFEEVCDEIEEGAFKQFKVDRSSILFEKIVGNYSNETEYNPLFKTMTKEEILEFQGKSTKVKINVAFEINIRVEKHLKLKALKEYFFGNAQ